MQHGEIRRRSRLLKLAALERQLRLGKLSALGCSQIEVLMVETTFSSAFADAHIAECVFAWDRPKSLKI